MNIKTEYLSEVMPDLTPHNWLSINYDNVSMSLVHEQGVTVLGDIQSYDPHVLKDALLFAYSIYEPVCAAIQVKLEFADPVSSPLNKQPVEVISSFWLSVIHGVISPTLPYDYQGFWFFRFCRTP